MNKQTVYTTTEINDDPDKVFDLYDSSYEPSKAFLKNVTERELYGFTPEELKQLLFDAFDAGYNYGYDSANMDEGYSLNYKNKEEYIENLFK